MSIGSKIKSLRKARGYTQAELAEGIISRSMLSLIENGSALPSMQSLCAIALRLGTSPAFLLEEGDDISPAETARIASIVKEEYKNGNFQNALEILTFSGLEHNSNFCDFYICCAFEVAMNAFFSGDYKTATELFNKVEALLSDTVIIPAKALISRIGFAKIVMKYSDDIEYAIQEVSNIPDFDFEPSVFFCLVKLLKEGRHDACQNLLDFCSVSQHYTNYINAQMLIKDYKFIDAIMLMKSITSDKSLPVFLRLFATKSTEICCKICEDFKGAYENHIAYQDILKDITR